jgi:ATP-dependent exoDNAse (exonuclease V) beta subunit
MIPTAVSLPTPMPVDLSAGVVNAAVSHIGAAHERAMRPSWVATSATAESKRLPRLAMESPDAFEASDPTRSVVQDTASHRADAGQAWGTLVHGLLEHAMRHRTATREDLRRLATWLTLEEPRLRKLIDQAIDCALAVVASDELQMARASAECHEEVPFAVLRDDTGTPTVVTGVIDLAYRAGEDWDVVDYKTDADAKDVDLKARHQAQLDAYEEAWSRVSGRKTRACVLGTR